ncbi:Wzz/FepE/Etk N-terminal domain-containing protein [Microbacterium sp. bgisy189]|uniref:Wzz/FepE/Etk N-terminal domain-containing protein n=1 Tax=Microbacterium sp. bgisy189 TaxID=3413798 RepID=UPI003EBC9C49
MDAIRRRWLLIVVITLLFAAAGAAATYFLPKTYASTTSVLVAPVTSNTNASVANGRTNGEINLDTEAQIVRSVTLADQVAADIGTDLTAREIAAAVSVTVPANSQVLNITFEADSAEAAQRGAEGYASAYLAQRRAGSEEAIAEAKAGIEAQLETLQEEFAEQTTRSRDEDLSDVDRAIASSQRETLVDQIAALNANLSALTRSAVNPGHVLSAADLPRDATSPSFVVNTAIGMVVGILAALSLAVILGQFDHRIRSPRDVHPRRRLRTHDELLSSTGGSDDHDPGLEEEVDQLRIAIDSSAAGDPDRVLVTPVGSNSGSDWIALSLGRAYARRLGSAVYAVIDPTSDVPRELGIDGPGITDLINGADATAIEVDATGLMAIGPGSSPQQLGRLLQRPRSVTRILGLTDTVLVAATPSVHDSAGAQAMLRTMDRVVVIGRAGGVDDRDLARTLESIERSQFTGTIVVALVAPDRRPRRARHRDAVPAESPAQATEADTEMRFDDTAVGPILARTTGGI